MSYLFCDCSSLSNIEGLQNLDVSSVTNMEGMFTIADFDSNKITEFRALARWNTRSVSNFERMFQNCGNATYIDLNNFDTSSAENMNSMFALCDNLKEIRVGEKWNTSNATTEEMFFYSGVDHVTK